jgi:hypothetical protein
LIEIISRLVVLKIFEMFLDIFEVNMGQRRILGHGCMDYGGLEEGTVGADDEQQSKAFLDLLELVADSTGVLKRVGRLWSSTAVDSGLIKVEQPHK